MRLHKWQIILKDQSTGGEEVQIRVSQLDRSGMKKPPLKGGRNVRSLPSDRQ